jgi:hypothetical protein
MEQLFAQKVITAQLDQQCTNPVEKVLITQVLVLALSHIVWLAPRVTPASHRD